MVLFCSLGLNIEFKLILSKITKISTQGPKIHYAVLKYYSFTDTYGSKE